MIPNKSPRMMKNSFDNNASSFNYSLTPVKTPVRSPKIIKKSKSKLRSSKKKIITMRNNDL